MEASCESKVEEVRCKSKEERREVRCESKEEELTKLAPCQRKGTLWSQIKETSQTWINQFEICPHQSEHGVRLQGRPEF